MIYKIDKKTGEKKKISTIKKVDAEGLTISQMERVDFDFGMKVWRDASTVTTSTITAITKYGKGVRRHHHRFLLEQTNKEQPPPPVGSTLAWFLVLLPAYP